MIITVDFAEKRSELLREIKASFAMLISKMQMLKYRSICPFSELIFWIFKKTVLKLSAKEVSISV